MGADGYVYQFMFMPTNDAGTQMADQIISTLNVLKAGVNRARKWLRPLA